MVRKWTLGATGFALLATTFVVVACSSKGDDDDNKGSGGTGGSTGGSAGKAPTAGTSTTGGSAGTGSNTGGTGGGTGGSTTGGGAGTGTGGSTAGTTSMGGAAGGTAAGFPCTMPVAANCDSYKDWGTASTVLGTDPFTGTVNVYGTGITRDMTVTDKVHITGTVSTYSGFNLSFSKCSSLATYTGVSFTISGTIASTSMPQMIQFNPQTNSDFPYTGTGVDASWKKGTCLPTDTTNPFGSCLPPAKTVMIMDNTAVPITWADMEATASGTPTKFTAAMSPAEIVGLQWQFPWGSAETAYMVDITLDDLTFTGAAMPKDCPAGASTGGMGGMGAGGAAGAAGATTAGQGGASGGQGGASGGRGGASGGQGGASGGQGGASGGRGGASGGRGGAAGTG